MKSMAITRIGLGVALAAAACSAMTKEKGNDPDHDRESAENHAEHDHGEPGHEGHDHDGHGHGKGGQSDLDRPPVELFAEACEHAMKAHECDECRYEVGMVRLDPRLIDRGLVRWTTVRN